MKMEITLRQVLIPAFLTVVVLPMLLMALFSILRLKANMQETLEMQIESNLEKADQVLDMVLDKYKTILYDFCTDDSIVEIVESVNEGVDDKDVNTGKLRREPQEMRRSSTMTGWLHPPQMPSGHLKSGYRI